MSFSSASAAATLQAPPSAARERKAARCTSSRRGRSRVSKRFAGKTHVVSVLEKGDFFGEMALVSRIQRTATVTAIDAVELLVFDREGLLNMITRNARIALNIIDKLCRRLQNAHHEDPAPGEAGCARADRPSPPVRSSRSFRWTAGSLPFQKCLDDISLSLELPMDDVRGVLGEMQAEGMLAMEGEMLRLADREKLLRYTESVGREAADPA